MRQIKNRSKTVKLLALLICAFLQACSSCWFSEKCHEERERKKFLMLSPEEQKVKREECMKWVPVSCYTYSEPAPEEIKSIKRENAHSSYQNPMSGGINGGNFGLSLGNGCQSRAWVDQATTIVGSNSVNINVGSKDSDENYINNTGDTNIIGAMINNINNNKIDTENLLSIN